MNRNIKFRAKYKLDSKVYYVGNIDLVWEEINIFSPDTTFDKNVSLDEVELLQYTGILDKNEQEIYEGDKVRFECNGAFYEGKVKYSYSSCGFVIEDRDNFQFLFSDIENIQRLNNDLR